MGSNRDDEGGTRISLPLEYGKPVAWRNRRTTRRALHALLVVLAIVIAVPLLAPQLKHLYFVHRQQAIWNYSAPSTQITYSDVSGDLRKLLARPGYQEMVWTWDLAQFGNAQRSLSFNPVTHIPPLLDEMFGLSSQGCAYLHAGKTVGGLPRVAAVLMTLNASAQTKRRLRLLGVAIQPAEYGPGARPLVIGQSGVDFFLDSTDGLRIFAGAPDPADPARFAIGYELNGQTGTIDGSIDNEYWVTLKVRDGPARTKSDQWSLFHDATGK